MTGGNGASVVHLFVMRHAKSAWDTDDVDYDRPLAPRGEAAAARMAAWLIERSTPPDYVLASKARRAADTARTVIEACTVDRSRWELRPDLYGATARDWLDEIRTHERRHASRLLIVGHNPDLDNLVEALSATPPPRAASGKLMTTAAIAHLQFDTDWPEIGPGAGRLIALQRPRELTS